MFLKSIDPETGNAMAVECHASAGSERHHGRHDVDGRNL
jgi:hypothetical protein